MNSSSNSIKLHKPAYYAPNDANIERDKKKSLPTRIVFAALPFIAIHKPFGHAITLTFDSIRTIFSFKQLIGKKDYKELFKTSITVAALAGTLFKHPLGILISTFYDMGFCITDVIVQLQAGDIQSALHTLLIMAQHALYAGTLVTGSIEIISFSLLLNMLGEVFRSKKEFLKGNFLEGFSHLLMSVVRFSQTLPNVKKIAYKYDIKGKGITQTLTTKMNNVRDRFAVFCYRSARFLIGGQWKLSTMWLNTIGVCKNKQSTKIQKLFSTSKSTLLSAIFMPLTLTGTLLGQISHFSAFLLSASPYIHYKGKAPIQNTTDKDLKHFQLNCCLTAGEFARIFGGVALSNAERTEQITNLIKEHNPDIVSMQEVSDIKEACSFHKKLSKDFSDFYFHMGNTPFILQNNSGLFVASKTPINNPEFHDFSHIKGIESMANKGFFHFSTDSAHFINTHLSPYEEGAFVREKEQNMILSYAKERFSKNPKPTFISGDFNIDWNSPEYHNSPFFKEGFDNYNYNRDNITDKSSTCDTDYLCSRNWHNDHKAKPDQTIIDYFVSFFTPKSSVNTKKIATYDIKAPKEAISDHAALLTKIMATNSDSAISISETEM